MSKSTVTHCQSSNEHSEERGLSPKVRGIRIQRDRCTVEFEVFRRESNHGPNLGASDSMFIIFSTLDGLSLIKSLRTYLWDWGILQILGHGYIIFSCQLIKKLCEKQFTVAEIYGLWTYSDCGCTIIAIHLNYSNSEDVRAQLLWALVLIRYCFFTCCISLEGVASLYFTVCCLPKLWPKCYVSL